MSSPLTFPRSSSLYSPNFVVFILLKREKKATEKRNMESYLCWQLLLSMGPALEYGWFESCIRAV